MKKIIPAALALGVGYYFYSKNRPSYSFQDRVVVITGGSRGLGLILARQLAAEGARLALLARDPEELERAKNELETSGAIVLACPCDITDQKQVDQAVEQIRTKLGPVEVLINNAGIIQMGPFEHWQIQDIEQALKVHFFGPLYTTLAVLPHMAERFGGRIVNISSVAGKLATPHLLPYTVSKFALTGLSESLALELQKYHIRVTTVTPGLMRTGSTRHALLRGRNQMEYAWLAIADSLPLISIDADRAGAKIIEACRKGKSRLVVSAPAKAAILLNEIAPEVTTRFFQIMNLILPKPDPEHNGRTFSGWESESKLAPSIFTKLGDEAALKNNEMNPKRF